MAWLSPNPVIREGHRKNRSDNRSGIHQRPRQGGLCSRRTSNDADGFPLGVWEQRRRGGDECQSATTQQQPAKERRAAG